jgi:hypothetical protein
MTRAADEGAPGDEYHISTRKNIVVLHRVIVHIAARPTRTSARARRPWSNLACRFPRIGVNRTVPAGTDPKIPAHTAHHQMVRGLPRRCAWEPAAVLCEISCGGVPARSIAARKRVRGASGAPREHE